VILLGQYKECNPYKSRVFDTERNLNAAASLISGPPGVGKTTTVRLLGRMLRY